jgi:hypothetical protein
MDKIALMTQDILRLRQTLVDIVNWKGGCVDAENAIGKPNPREMAIDALLIDSPIGNNNGLKEKRE